MMKIEGNSIDIDVLETKIALNNIMLDQKVDTIKVHFSMSLWNRRLLAKEIYNYFGTQITYGKWYDLNQSASIFNHKKDSYFCHIYIGNKGPMEIIFNDKTYKEVELFVQVMCKLANKYANKKSIWVEIFNYVYFNKITYPVVYKSNNKITKKKKDKK